jgi:hypothetical protein
MNFGSLRMNILCLALLYLLALFKCAYRLLCYERNNTFPYQVKVLVK